VAERFKRSLLSERIEQVEGPETRESPSVYELTRISYETAGGQLGHLPDGEDPSDVVWMTFEVVGEPSDTPHVVDIAIADSR
jgi:hypothetical protein